MHKVTVYDSAKSMVKAEPEYAARLLQERAEIIQRLQMELDASCNAEELRLVREENERLRKEIAALKKRVDKPLGA